MGDFNTFPYRGEFNTSFYKPGTPYDEVFTNGSDRGAGFTTQPVPGPNVKKDYVFVTKASIGHSDSSLMGPWPLGDGKYITDHLGIATKITLPPQ